VPGPARTSPECSDASGVTTGADMGWEQREETRSRKHERNGLQSTNGAHEARWAKRKRALFTSYCKPRRELQINTRSETEMEEGGGMWGALKIAHIPKHHSSPHLQHFPHCENLKDGSRSANKERNG